MVVGWSRYRKIGGFAVGAIAVCIVKVLPVSLLMGAGAWWINKQILTMLGSLPFANLISLFVAIGAGILFYGLSLSMLRIHEVEPLKQKLLSMVRREA